MYFQERATGRSLKKRQAKVCTASDYGYVTHQQEKEIDTAVEHSSRYVSGYVSWVE